MKACPNEKCPEFNRPVNQYGSCGCCGSVPVPLSRVAEAVGRRSPLPGVVGGLGERPRLLDLFSCAGGAAMGYHLAGFEVVGVE